MWRVVKGHGVDFVMSELPAYSSRMADPVRVASDFRAYAMRGAPSIAVSSKDVDFSLDRVRSDLARAEFEALFKEFARGSRTWHLHQLTDARLSIARFSGAKLVKESRVPAVIATVIGSQVRELTGCGFTVQNYPASADLLVEEDRRSEIRIAVCALIPGPEPKRVLLFAQSAPFLGRLRMRLKPGQWIEDLYPPPSYFDKLGNGVAAVMSTLIDGASLLVS